MCIHLKIWIICFCLAIDYFLLSQQLASSCSRFIPNGKIAWWCSTYDAIKDKRCPYTCYKGYKESDNITMVSCSSSGQWLPFVDSPGTATLNDLCRPKPCQKEIPNGVLSSPCVGEVGSNCSYTCDTGYQTKSGIPYIECETSTNWSPNPHTLCTSDNQCPYEVLHGDLDLSCTRRPGEMCSYTCHQGFRPAMTILPRTVTCSFSLNWNQSLNTLCEQIYCPRTLPDGSVPPTSNCTREYSTTCKDYQCNSGYTKVADEFSIKCNTTGQWEWNSNSKPCTILLCPSGIQNGYVASYCHRRPGAVCSYTCNSGFVKHQTTRFLTCDSKSKWTNDTDRLCTPMLLCPSVFRNGYVDWNCHRRPGAVCSYTCNSGFVKHETTKFLTCNTNSKWTNDTDQLCTPSTYTTAAVSICPPFIKNGRINSRCNRSAFSLCDFSCNPGCSKTVLLLYCHSKIYWQNGNTACSCQARPTLEPHDVQSNRHAVLVSIVSSFLVVGGGVIVAVWISYFRKRRNVSQTRYNAPVIHYM